MVEDRPEPVLVGGSDKDPVKLTAFQTPLGARSDHVSGFFPFPLMSPPHLPTELWFETFTALPRKTLISLHSTSRLFHQISRPLLFGEFDFRPFKIEEGASSRYADQHDVDRSTKRLEFWASPDVAPFVRGCTFSAFCRSRDDPSPVFATFFRLLPNLSNLQELTCVIVKFDRTAVNALCSLPNLVRVELTGCSLGEEVAGLLLRIKSFRCAHIGSVRAAGAHRWLNILDKDTLTDLILPSAPSASDFLEGTTPNFLSVQRLLLGGIKAWPELHLLSYFPTVRSLYVTWCPAYRRDERPPMLFPQLDTYDGPHEILLFVDPCAAPRRLCISPTDPQLLLERLFTARPVLRAVEQLVLSLNYLQPDVLGGCLASFSNLRELRMKVFHLFDDMQVPDGEMHTRQTFYDSLATRSPFPQTLEKLYISWPAHTSLEPYTPPTLASAQDTKDTLLRAHSELKCIWLLAPQFEYLWIRRRQHASSSSTEDGTEFTRATEVVGGRDSRTRLGMTFQDPQDTFVLRYTNA